MAGYLDPLYIESLKEWGNPLRLNESKGWILERPISDSLEKDAMGPYPIFMCEDWSSLGKDLEKLGDSLVSVSLVTDPFGNYSRTELVSIFDIANPFKEHYITDLEIPIESITTSHHRYYARKGFKDVHVDVIENPIEHLEEWVDLYQSISERHNIRNIRAFSRTAFENQLKVPGMVMFRAEYQNRAVGEALCLIHDDIAYGHLMGINAKGHELGVSYPIYWTHLTYLKDKVKWINWGGISGINSEDGSGLARFKKGWSTGTRTAYFCGKILNQEKYSKLVNSREKNNSGYFPAYRIGEMG